MEIDGGTDAVMALLGQIQQEARKKAADDDMRLRSLEAENKKRAEATEAALSDALAELRVLRGLNSATQATLQTPTQPSAPETPAMARAELGTRPRHTALPDLPLFDGTTKKYRVWRANLLQKLRVDGAAIGTPANQFAYIYSRLGDDAQEHTVDYTQSLKEELQDPHEYIRYLDTIYQDANDAARARDELRYARQGKQEPIAAFLVRFDQLLARCGMEASGDDLSRKTWLKNALNTDIHTQTFQLPEVSTYAEYKTQLRTVGARVEGFLYMSAKSAVQTSEPPRSTVLPAAVDPDAMDLRAGKAGASGDVVGILVDGV